MPATAYPSETIDVLTAGEVLLAEGDVGGALHVLISGELVVERDGVVLSTLNTPGTLIGEMSVLLHGPTPPRCAPRRKRASAPSRMPPR